MTDDLKCVMVSIGPKTHLISEPMSEDEAKDKLSSIRECLSRNEPFSLRGTIVSPSKVAYAHIVNYRPEEVEE